MGGYNNNMYDMIDICDKYIYILKNEGLLVSGLVWDYTNYGRSDYRFDSTKGEFEIHANDLSLLIEYMKPVKSVILWSKSTGCIISLITTIYYPSLINSLILYNCYGSNIYTSKELSFIYYIKWLNIIKEYGIDELIKNKLYQDIYLYRKDKIIQLYDCGIDLYIKCMEKWSEWLINRYNNIIYGCEDNEIVSINKHILIIYSMNNDDKIYKKNISIKLNSMLQSSTIYIDKRERLCFNKIINFIKNRLYEIDGE
eukprot:GHVL01039722.1.p1 GENE.GHVL01039722.1~~GHVL01039722.1.p1  ORF type:complete len:255 (+),score=83.15 GHVL01039722.1:607-1371(+)